MPRHYFLVWGTFEYSIPGRPRAPSLVRFCIGIASVLARVQWEVEGVVNIIEPIGEVPVKVVVTDLSCQ